MFALAHLSGYSIALAECGPARSAFGIDHTLWEGAALAAAAIVVVLAEAASIAVLRGARTAEARFIAIGATTANVLFFTICILDLAGELALKACRGA